jgi:hypothetical protein
MKNIVLKDYGAKKYLTLRDKEAFVDESKIERDALWDRLHGVISNTDELTPHSDNLPVQRAVAN